MAIQGNWFGKPPTLLMEDASLPIMQSSLVFVCLFFNIYLRLSALLNPLTSPPFHPPTSSVSLTSLPTPARLFPSHLDPSTPESHCSFGPPPPLWAFEAFKDPKTVSWGWKVSLETGRNPQTTLCTNHAQNDPLLKQHVLRPQGS